MAYTKEQAKQEWERYRRARQETAAAQLEAAQTARAEALRAAQHKAEDGRRAAQTAAQTAYDAARIQQLADAYRLAEQIANRGATRGGQAAAAQAGVAYGERVARRNALRKRKDALTAVGRELTVAREKAQNAYGQTYGTVQRQLAQDLENKKLTLERSIKEEKR
jgi:hypothetical protein